MTIDRRLLAGALALSLALAACGTGTASPAATSGGASASPTTAPASEPPASSAAPTESATAEATEAPTEEPTEAASGDTGLGGDRLTDLAELLPAEAGGVAWSRVGFNGDELGLYGASLGVTGDQLDPILEAHGKTLADVNMAIGAPTSGDTSGGMAYAIQIEGVEATEFMAEMQLDPATMETTSIAGKDVYSQAAGGFGIWVYPNDDVLFVILLAPEAVAEEIIAQLP